MFRQTFKTSGWNRTVITLLLACTLLLLPFQEMFMTFVSTKTTVYPNVRNIQPVNPLFSNVVEQNRHQTDCRHLQTSSTVKNKTLSNVSKSRKINVFKYFLHKGITVSDEVGLLVDDDTEVDEATNAKFADIAGKKADSEILKTMMSWMGNKPNPIITLTGDYLITPRDPCPEDRLDYLIIVNTATEHSARRDAIRRTFGQSDVIPGVKQRVIFLVGRSRDDVINQRLTSEAEVHGDLVQGDYLDTYHNLTLKGASGLRWIHESCPNVRYVVKLDDDVFLNVFQMNHFPIVHGRHHAIACHFNWNLTSTIMRDETAKWYVDDSYFPGQSRYPFPYCNGFFVIMTSDMVRPLLEAMQLVPFFWVDDVYLFGMLPLLIGHVNMIEYGVFIRGYYQMLNCLKQEGRNCEMMVIHESTAVHEKQMAGLWADIQRLYCS